MQGATVRFGAFETAGVVALWISACGTGGVTEQEAAQFSTHFTADPAKQAAAPHGAAILAATPEQWTNVGAGYTGLQCALRAGDRITSPETSELYEWKNAGLWTNAGWWKVPTSGPLEQAEAPEDGIYLLMPWTSAPTSLAFDCMGRDQGVCGSCVDDPGFCQRIDPGSTLTCGVRQMDRVMSFHCTYQDELGDPSLALTEGPNALAGVIERPDGGRVQGLLVSIGGRMTETDAGGYYQLDSLQTGTFIVAVRDGEMVQRFRVGVWAPTVQDLVFTP